MKKLFVSAFAVFACLLSFNLSAAECTGFSLEWSGLTHYELNSFYLADETDYDPNLWMQFYQDEETGKITAGTYDLGSTINSTYKTCTECVYLQSDLVGEGEDAKYSKVYYQKSGTLTIEAVDASNEIKGTIQAVLAEATIADDLTTTFVTDGGCIEIETATFDSGVCVPDCTGKICGDDGCGGTCGEGCGDLACSEDQKSCVEYECTQITLGKISDAYADADYGEYSYNFNHTPAVVSSDYTTFELYDVIEAGEYDLADTNYTDCTVCMQLFEETTVDDEGSMTGIGRRYFQKSGKVNVTSFNDATGAINASLNKVRLVEVTVDSSTWISTEVAGGKCYDIKDVTFSYPAGNDTGSDPADTGDTGSDPADTGDTGSNPDDTADTDDTEVPGDTTDTEVPGDTGSAPSDGTDATPSDDDAASDDDATPEKEDKDSSGCSVVTL